MKSAPVIKGLTVLPVFVSRSRFSLSFLPSSTPTCVSIILHASQPKGVITVIYRIQVIPPSCHIWHPWSCLVYTDSFLISTGLLRVLRLEVSHSPPVSLPPPSPSPSAVTAAVYFHSVEMMIKSQHYNLFG